MIDLRLFETVEEYERARAMEYSEPWTSLVDSIERVDYNMTEEERRERLKKQPLTFKVTSDGVIRWTSSYTNSSVYKTIQYSKNGGDWASIKSATGSSAPSIGVSAGDTVQFRGTNNYYSSATSRYNGFSGTTCSFEMEGNIMSLINSTNFSGLTSIPAAYAFCYMFFSCTGLTNAGNLLFPATGLTDYCYNNMFRACTSLTKAPELPAETLVSYAYNLMFSGCTNLNYIKCLATNISASNCTTNWLSSVASSGTFVKAASMTGWTTGVSGIPNNWTVKDA